MQGLHQGNRVAQAIKKIRIAECDVLRSGSNLLPDVSKNNFPIDDPKYAIVNRNDRAMPANMLAAATRFRVTRDAMLSVGEH
jgi:hypothetical protein